MQNERCYFLIYDHNAIRMSSVNSIEVNDTFILINNTTLVLPMTLTTEQREIVLKRIILVVRLNEENFDLKEWLLKKIW